jgi:cell division protein FtsW
MPRSSLGSVNIDVYADVRARNVAAARRPDAPLALIVLALVVLGQIMVQSASQYADPLDPGYFARRDLLWAVLGGAALWLMMHIDYHRLRVVVRSLVAVALFLTALTVKLGAGTGGAQRWLSLGSFLSVQPSELAKLALVIFAADHLAHHSGQMSIRAALPVLAVGGVLVGLVLLQNDLGTALILAASTGAMLMVAGLPVAQWLALGTGTGAIAALAILAAPFRRARLEAFLHPLQCGTATSYQICQSLLAIGSGGIVGRGLGEGLQKAGFLPAPFTDAIFAIAGEELGLWGALAIIALFGALLWRGLRIAREAPDACGALLAMGIVTWLTTQAVLNIGSSVAALPFTGVPLPFISYGGSSLVVSLAAIGVLLNISAQGAGHAARLAR